MIRTEDFMAVRVRYIQIFTAGLLEGLTYGGIMPFATEEAAQEWATVASAGIENPIAGTPYRVTEYTIEQIVEDAEPASEVVNFGRGYQAVYKGRLCTPTFQDKGAALAYISILDAGVRQPEYA
jgi:hypothetical protein